MYIINITGGGLLDNRIVLFFSTLIIILFFQNFGDINALKNDQLVSQELVLSASVSDSQLQITDGGFGSYNTISIAPSLGENSVSFAQLSLPQDRHLFVGRKAIGDTGLFKLVLARLEKAGNQLRYTYKQDVFNTVKNVKIHDGLFKIRSAYDPAISWFKGTYWIAFECTSDDFSKVMNVNSSVSVCMGPLNSKYRLIPSKTRVVVMGGKPKSGSIVRTASVPKIFSDSKRIYLYWTSVTIDKKLGFFEQRRSIAQEDVIQKIPEDDNTLQAVYSNYEKLVNVANDLGEAYVSYKNLSRLKISGIANKSESQFYIWQANTLNAFNRGVRWKAVAEGLRASKLAPYMFQKLSTYGAKLQFNQQMQPFINSSDKRNKKGISFAWQTNHFSPILLPNTSVPSENRVADVFHIQQLGNKIYFTAAVGGSLTKGNDIENQHFCIAPTIGYSDKGCYRLEVFTSNNPLQNLRELGERGKIQLNLPRLNQNEKLRYPSQDFAHEYSKFFQLPNGKTALVAKFLGDGGKLRYFILNKNLLFHVKMNQDRLAEGQGLYEGDFLLSKNQRYSLTVHRGGLSLFDRNNAKVIWDVKRPGSSQAFFILQKDGHLVFYPKKGFSKNHWSTNKYGNQSTLVMQDDGNLVQYSQGRAIFHTK